MREPDDDAQAPRGVTVEVLVAAVCFAVSAALVSGWVVVPQEPPSAMLILGWPFFAVAGGVVLDRRPTSPVGRVLTVLGLVPVACTAMALARTGRSPTSQDLAQAVTELAGLQAAAVAVAVPWAFRPPENRRRGTALAAVAAAGGLAVLCGEAQLLHPAAVPAGWAAVALSSAAVWTEVVRSARDDDRTGRRRITWVLVTLALAAAIVTATVLFLPAAVAYYAVGFSLVTSAVVMARLCFVTEFRPLDEHALDVAVVLGAIGAAALVGVLVGLGSSWTQLPSPRTTAVFAALVTATMAVPAALWVRNSLLARRYGNGIISPSDVAAITADLHAQTEPRDLLDKAARVVAAASGSGQAQIVLGDDLPVIPEQWVLHPLVVGGDQVGALLVESGGPDGPEPRQQRAIAQLLPTVALVARAVGLAVEAEHARRNVARERDAERTRILGDLHDGLGPVLAGMSMRVQASLRTGPPPEYVGLLTDLAGGLAGSRTELRRIVAGITPSALDDGNLEAALDRLVESFRGGDGACRIGLEVALDRAVDGTLAPDVQVAVYRSVAEGVTNALRHAAATAIEVRVQATDGVVRVDVVDDGRGGVVVPGVGLSSLASRARSLGGCLEVSAATPAGTRLHVELPVSEGAQR